MRALCTQSSDGFYRRRSTHLIIVGIRNIGGRARKLLIHSLSLFEKSLTLCLWEMLFFILLYPPEKIFIPHQWMIELSKWHLISFFSSLSPNSHTERHGIEFLFICFANEKKCILYYIQNLFLVRFFVRRQELYYFCVHSIESDLNIKRTDE